MSELTRRFDANLAVGLGAIAPVVLGTVLVPLRDDLAIANVVLLFVVLIVLAAVVGSRPAGVTSAISSALAFDFFHVRPYLSLKIEARDDVETTVLLLLVGVIVGTLASSHRKARASMIAGRDDLRRVHRLADLVAGGTEPAEVVAQATTELADLLHLAGCHFELRPYRATLPRLDRSGVVRDQQTFKFSRHGFELPADGVVLPVLARGKEVGRFVLLPDGGYGTTVEERAVAIALADQVGAAFADSPPPGSMN
ncbi:MAG: DUF4118 domain-containing protein [Acidobacteria bacterium]|nr:DUF4118 domain-containing protein [Acidobacteriota bacterium]